MRCVVVVLTLWMGAGVVRADVMEPANDPVPPARPDPTGEPSVHGLPDPAPQIQPPPYDVTPGPPVRSYRGMMIAIDLAAIALVPVGGLGLVPYVLGAPIIHAAHGNSSHALKSFLGRTLIPVGVTFGVAYALGAQCDFSESCGLGAAIIGLLAGGAAAVVVMGVDWYHARTIEPVRRATARTVLPTLHVGDGVAQLGLVGRW